jgi:hypothetical protein
VWPELKREILVEQESLARLLSTHRILIEKCATRPPDAIELSALSAMLHSFYTGIENLFKRVAVRVDGGPPGGDLWHSRLLESMTEATPKRPAMVSEALRNTLRGYLSFRHVFRHAYTFELRWPKMEELVLDVDKTLARLEEELARFAEQMDQLYPESPTSGR